MKKKKGNEVREPPSHYSAPSEKEIIRIIEEILPSLVMKRPELKLKLRAIFDDVATKSDIASVLEELKKLREDTNKRFAEMREDTDRRFEKMREDMDKRFAEMREDMDKRFAEMREDMDKRFAEMREDMDKRFAEMREYMDRRFEKMREDMDKKFAEMREDMDKRFAEMREYMDRRFEKMREDMDKRFAEMREDMDKRFGEMRIDFRDAIEKTSKALSSKIDTVGSRWGIMAENSMRELLQEVVSKAGFKTIKWRKEDEEGRFFLRPRSAEIDILIKDTKTIAIEVKSSLTKSEVDDFEKCVRFYEEVEGKKVDEKIILAIYSYPGVREYASEFGIRIISEPEEIKG